ncbi:MAG: agmatinase, partial [Pseudomonadota bacterium]
MSDDRTPDRALYPAPPAAIGEENWFAGVTSLFRRRYSIDPAGADLAILGIPFDQAVSNRPGARFGPRAIRAASSNLAWPGGPWRWPRDPFKVLNVIDTGDVAFDTGTPETMAALAAQRASAILSTGARLLALGGDHFITYPLLRAHAARYGPLALIQFDSHSDTWREPVRRLDHGTMLFHAVQEGIIDPTRSIQVGIRSGNAETHGFEILDADAVADTTPHDIAAAIKARVGPGPAYLTFDIDFLDPAYAPGT